MNIDELKTKYAAELQYLQSVFSDMGIAANESVLVMQINKAYTAIRKYLRLDTDADVSKHFDAAVELAIAYYNNHIVMLNKTAGKRTISQKSQGSRSVTYGSAEIALDYYGISESVKALLPNPPIRFY